ncbi:hypothetical protein OSB04_un001387 [Centaurea solstitialis]|uniref:Reverse transcriptase domain-containing protein n=1 Tax=Centaurea solstitialis TaxID=347529 RepID=A0AA38SAV3_9ASTR|nr:hypothetical protein OSB04_un001387 [Centaurea solstitialis]
MDAMDQLIAPSPIADGNSARPSVFERLSTADDRLKFPEGFKSGKDFAEVVGRKHSDDSLSFFPLVDKAQSRVQIPVELATKVMNTHKSTLFGYFLGPRLQFPVVERYVKAVWGKFGFVEAMMNNNGIFFFKFNDVGGSKQVVEAGPLMIRGVPLFVSHWDPAKAFNKEGISRIASALGVPKQMDACTTSMCDKDWGRPGFAKVLIDVWAVGELKREVQVIIPSITGGADVSVGVRVEYIWEPTQCTHCLVFGHKVSSCAKAVVASSEKKKAAMTNVDDEGFTRVGRKEWRAKPGVARTDPGPSSAEVTDVVVPTPSVDVDSESHKTNVSQVNLEVVETEVVNANTPSPPLQTSSVAKDDDSNSKKLAKGTREGKEIKDIRAQKAPIKGILKNPNRFAALSTDASVKARGDVPAKGVVGSRRVCLSIAQMFNIAFWNIRGLNATDKQQEVKSFIRNNNLSLCAILETHIRVESLRGVCERTFGRWEWVSNQIHSDYGTRIIVAWNAADVDVMVLESHGQFMHCEVRIRGLDQVFFVSFVYGANRGLDRRQLWSGLRKFRAILGAKPWLIAGDFNCLLFPHDALGGISRRNGDMADFASCVEDVDVFDVRFSGIQYTWCQKPREEAGLKRKLDRILANVEFTNLFCDAGARFLPRAISDHSPGLIGFTGGTRTRKYGFKFDNFLALDPQFLSTVQQAWRVDIDGTFMFKLTSRLKLLKTPLRRLRSAYGNLSRRSVSLKDELDIAQLAADIDPGNVSLQSDVSRLREDYQKSCWIDISATRQRAKVKWLLEGDANTRYFHQVVAEKRHAQHLYSVCKADGVYVYDDDVAKAFIEHFVSISGTKDFAVVPDMPDFLFTNRLSIGDANHMIRPIQDSEIHDAMFSIGNDKAPGPDGFLSKFFKAAWSVIGQDVLVAIHNFFYRGRLAKELNHTLLCLLPKSTNATLVSDFRPIACCNVLYKCISKVIVERMKPYLDSIVSKTQSAFIPGRKITDNILMAHELVSGYQLDRGPPRCAFKIDLRKAYDMVSWEYLLGMLNGLGFHPTLVKWIKEMITTPSFSIALNGESHGFFQGQRGIRQGDLLSPYLFTIVMEGFSMLFNQCIQEAAAFGYHHGCEVFGISHLCFADDLFVFTKGDVASVEVLKKTLDLFAKRSGLSPNLQKSDVFFGNVAPDVQSAIIQCLPFRSGNFPIRYLGVPLSPVSLKMADYGVLVTKVKLRLQNWKTKFLSFGGRKQLIISVLQSLQLYWMGVFVFPSGVIHELESLFRDFLWAQGESSRGRCKVAWSLVCRPTECGGLGFRRLAAWNRALISRNLWAIVSNRDCLWVKWVRQISLRDMIFWSARKTNRWSWVLRKMMGIREEMRRYVSVRIGNGLTTNAWEDSWLQCGPLSEFVSHRFIHAADFSVNTTVHQLITEFSDGWPINWMERYPILSSAELPTITDGVDDVTCWNASVNGDGVFSVQRAYQAFVGQYPMVTWANSVWFKGHIPKHSFCLWTACLFRLPTQDRIAEWKHDPPDLRCSLCGIVRDSHNHLFFECTFSRQIWLQVMAKLDWNGFPCSWDAIMAILSDSVVAPRQLERRLALAASIYVVWCERNRRLFSNDSKPIPYLVKLILDCVFDRIAWKRRKKVISMHVDP